MADVFYLVAGLREKILIARRQDRATCRARSTSLPRTSRERFSAEPMIGSRILLALSRGSTLKEIRGLRLRKSDDKNLLLLLALVNGSEETVA